MLCVVTVLAADDELAGEPGVPEFPVRTLTPGAKDKPGAFQVGNQLANLAWPTPTLPVIPVPCQPAFRLPRRPAPPTPRSATHHELLKPDHFPSEQREPGVESDSRVRCQRQVHPPAFGRMQAQKAPSLSAGLTAFALVALAKTPAIHWGRTPLKTGTGRLAQSGVSLCHIRVTASASNPTSPRASCRRYSLASRPNRSMIRSKP